MQIISMMVTIFIYVCRAKVRSSLWSDTLQDGLGSQQLAPFRLFCTQNPRTMGEGEYSGP